MENKILIRDSSIGKYDPSTRKALSKAIDKLGVRLNTYRSQNITISHIFNDDRLVHDIIKTKDASYDYYVYKTVSSNLQLRLLYTVDDDDTIVIVSHFLKKKKDNSYLIYFKKIVDNIKC